MCTLKPAISSLEYIGYIEHKKKCLTNAQRKTLIQRLQANEYLTKGLKRELAMEFNISERSVAHWYSKIHRKKEADPMSSQSECYS